MEQRSPYTGLNLKMAGIFLPLTAIKFLRLLMQKGPGTITVVLPTVLRSPLLVRHLIMTNILFLPIVMNAVTRNGTKTVCSVTLITIRNCIPKNMGLIGEIPSKLPKLSRLLSMRGLQTI